MKENPITSAMQQEDVGPQRGGLKNSTESLIG